MGDFLEQLEEKYKAAGVHNLWAHERPRLVDTLSAINESIAKRYEIVRPIAIGGSGVAVLVKQRYLGDELAVLKFPRPVKNSMDKIDEILSKETARLRQLKHHNIIRIIENGSAQYTDSSENSQRVVHYYVMEHLSNPTDIDMVFSTPDVSDDDPYGSIRNVRGLSVLFRDAVAGVKHMHDEGIAHCDLKPANIFVSDDHHVVVADFGFAKRFKGDISGDDFTTTVGGTARYMHPDFLKLAIESNSEDGGESNRTIVDQLERRKIVVAWDLFSLGVTLLELLSALDRYDPRGITEYARRYLRLMAYRMLDGRIGNDASVLGLQKSTLTELKYVDISEVLDDMDKLIGTYNISNEVPEIRQAPDAVIQDASHGAIPFTGRVKSIIETPELRKLAHLRQLGFIDMVYPGATHNRLEHTLGTFGLTVAYIRALYNDPVNPIFRQIMTSADVRAILVSALVHDIGHYPLAHDLEEVHASIFSHEERTVRLLRESKRLREVIEDEWDVPVDRVLAILTAAPYQSKHPIKDRILHTIIDGPIDADKVDYLIRDSENLRLPYGSGIDYKRLIQSLTVTIKNYGERSQALVGINHGGKIAAESIAFVRYALYGSVYWHRTHRAVKAMLNRVAFEALDEWYKADGSLDKGKYTNNARAKLWEFLESDNRRNQLQMSFRDEQNEMQTAFVDADINRMLGWLDRGANGAAKEIIEMLQRRELYKRVFVASQNSIDAAIHWEHVNSVFEKPGANWRKRHRVSVLLQDYLVRAVSEWSSSEAASTLSTIDATSLAVRFKARAEEPLVLVDLPPDKPGSNDSLNYLREQDGYRPESDSFVIGDLEESPVWKILRGDARKSLSKLRVFVHPEFAGIVSVAVSRTQFETLIGNAIEEARQFV